MGVKFYDPDMYVVSMGGVRIQGFADGEFFTYKRAAKAFERVTGTDGETARSKSNNKCMDLTVKLLQTSASNLYLSTLHNADLNGPNGAGVAPFLVQDLQGKTVLSAQQSWVTKAPDGSADRTAKPREWEIETGICEIIEGGN